MLIDVINDIRARFVAQGSTTSIKVGRRFLAQQAAANRIVIVPSDDQFTPIQSFNGAINPQNAALRPLMTRAAGADVHCWGAGADPTASTADDDAIAATELLVHAFLREFYHVVRGQNRRISGHWNNEILDVVYGAEYILQVSVDIPVTDLPKKPLPQGASIATTYHLGATSEAG